MSLSDVARIVGVHHSLASSYADPEQGALLPAADLSVLPPLALRSLVADLAEQLGCVLADAPSTIEQGDDLRALAAITRACGEVAAHFADALSDAIVDAQEAERIEREAGEAMRVLGALRERCRFAARVHGDGIRRGAK